MEPIDLGKYLEARIAELVEGGHYSSRDEVLRSGVRLVLDREARITEADIERSRQAAVRAFGLDKPIPADPDSPFQS